LQRRDFLRSGVIFASTLAAMRSVPPAWGASVEPIGQRFIDVTSRSGLRFRHTNAATGQKFLMETMGPGCAFFDYDNDGYLDIYFVNGCPLPGFTATQPLSNALYHNNGDGTFTDVTDKAGLRGQGYGMGVVAADYNNDGLQDLFVTSFQSSTLYRNNGDGTFTDVTKQAGLNNRGWGTSAAFFDYDNDGLLDLFICNYVDFSLTNNVKCGSPERGRGYCSPENFDGHPCALYHNNGDGTFTDVTAQSGIGNYKAKALGIVTADFTGNGFQDIYVANDRIANLLFLNDGSGKFREVATLAGAAYSASGRAQSGMGVAAGDYDHDGKLDIVVTNLSLEGYSVFHNDGDGLFTDVSFPCGVGPPSLMKTGWGVVLFDYDNDGRDDLISANGHAMDNVSEASPDIAYPQPLLLLKNTGGHFEDVTAQLGESLLVPRPSRGLAVGDYDNDGNLDLLVCTCNGPAVLLKNTGNPKNHWLKIQVVGRKSNRDGIGVKVSVTAGGVTQMKEVIGGGSYLSCSDRRLHFGLGNNAVADQVVLHWPSGIKQRQLAVKADRILKIEEATA
jgi:enediyne biosynthesis protein E4